MLLRNMMYDDNIWEYIINSISIDYLQYIFFEFRISILREYHWENSDATTFQNGDVSFLVM